MNPKWTQQDIPDQTDKVVVVTGANSGLGFESSKVLAGKGATVVLAVRSLDKGEKARAEILNVHPNAALDVTKLDVGDLKSVHEFAVAFKAKYDRLDILLNNAGVMAIPRQETADGFEMQFGVNHLGHFALTGLLLDVLVRTPNARIHNVTSTANFSADMDFDDLMGEREYGRWKAYRQSKLANVFFTFELQKRLGAAGFDTIANVSHPGLVIGQLQANSVEQSGTGMEAIIYRVLSPILAQDVSMGILSMLYGMTAPDAKGGALYGPRWFQHRGYPAELKANSKAYDAEALKRLWEVSEELTDVHYAMLDRAVASV